MIGNPPYVRQELFKEIKPYLEKNYKCYNSVADLYTYFIEKGIHLMNDKGLFSFILPNKFLKATYGKQIRKVIKEDANLELLLDFDDYPVFAEATTYPIIYVLSKNRNKEFFLYSEINKRDKTNDPIYLLEQKKHKVSFDALTNDMWNFIDETSFKILTKLNVNAISLEKLVDKNIFYGIKTGKNEAFIIDGLKRDELIEKNQKNKERIKILATGKEVKRNTFNFQDKYLMFTGYDINIPEEYPDIINELDKFKEALIKRGDKGENYWNLRSCAYYGEMQMPKIIYPRINNKCNFYLDEKGDVFLLDNNFFISTNSKALLALLNSKLIFFYLKNICTTLQGGFYDFRRDKVSTIPINKLFDINDKILTELSTLLISYTNQSNKTISNFCNYLISQFSIQKLTKKLQNWHELAFGEFIKEVNKAIKKENKERVKAAQTSIATLTKIDEMDWMDVFEIKKEEAQILKAQIDKTDKEIDQMVYELYELTPKEISIIESSTK